MFTILSDWTAPRSGRRSGRETEASSAPRAASSPSQPAVHQIRAKESLRKCLASQLSQGARGVPTESCQPLVALRPNCSVVADGSDATLDFRVLSHLCYLLSSLFVNFSPLLALCPFVPFAGLFAHEASRSLIECLTIFLTRSWTFSTDCRPSGQRAAPQGP